jgi:hypothetical protein
MLRLPRIRPLPRILSSTNIPNSTFVITTRMSSTARPLHVAPTPEQEEAALEAEIKAIEEWWSSPRFKGIKRPYSAREVATKRGNLPQTYPSSEMAKKLFSLLSERSSQGLPVHTSMSELLLPHHEVRCSEVDRSRSSDIACLLIRVNFSGSYRPRSNDPASSQPRSPLRLRMGSFVCSNHHQRGFPGPWRLPLQYRSQSGPASFQGSAAS